MVIAQREQLDQAVALFRDMGMDWWTEQAEGLRGLESIRERVYALATGLRERLQALPGVTVRDLGRERRGIVTFTNERMEAPALKAALAAEGINVSTTGPSSTLLDMNERGLVPMVRASVHYYNSEGELNLFTETVGRLTG